MENYEIKIIDIDLLKPHEMIVECHLLKLAEEIKRDGLIKDPIIVDRNTMIILDGHHRFNALKRMGMNFCPVCLVDYKNENIKVGCWRKNENVTKEKVIAAGITGKLLVPKTSKHEIPGRPVSLMIPLEKLR